jgi:hypothetical protein
VPSKCTIVRVIGTKESVVGTEVTLCTMLKVTKAALNHVRGGLTGTRRGEDSDDTTLHKNNIAR